MSKIRKFASFISILFILYLVILVIKSNFVSEEYPSGMINDQTSISFNEIQNEGLSIGSNAPNFVLETLSGDTVELSDLRGKKILLNFWASWCSPCIEEIPHMQEYYLKNFDQGEIEILGINMTKRESSLKNIEEFVEKYKISFPILLDSNGEIENLYQVIAYPTTYIINEEGIIIHSFKGSINSSEEINEFMSDK